MSLDPRAIALQGIGFAPLAVAALGLVGIEAPPVVQPPRQAGAAREDRQRRRKGIFPDLPRELVPTFTPDPHSPSLPRRTRRRRDGEWLLMQH